MSFNVPFLLFLFVLLTEKISKLLFWSRTKIETVHTLLFTLSLEKHKIDLWRSVTKENDEKCQLL